MSTGNVQRRANLNLLFVQIKQERRQFACNFPFVRPNSDRPFCNGFSVKLSRCKILSSESWDLLHVHREKLGSSNSFSSWRLQVLEGQLRSSEAVAWFSLKLLLRGSWGLLCLDSKIFEDLQWFAMCLTRKNYYFLISSIASEIVDLLTKRRHLESGFLTQKFGRSPMLLAWC